MPTLRNDRHERFCQQYHKLRAQGVPSKQARTDAYRAAGYSTDDKHIADNARKLSHRAEVRARLAELADYAAKLVGIDAAWATLEIKRDIETAGAFNIDDFLAPPNPDGVRRYDLSKATRAQLDNVASYTVKDTKFGTEIKLDGPNKYAVRATGIALLAKLHGWEAPKKITPTDLDGETLEVLVVGSYSLKEPKK